MVNFLNDNHIDLFKRPLYSPDLLTCDFVYFIIKQGLRGKCFTERDELIDTFLKGLNKLKSKHFLKCFDTWIKRCNGVIEKNGDYI